MKDLKTIYGSVTIYSCHYHLIRTHVRHAIHPVIYKQKFHFYIKFLKNESLRVREARPESSK